MFNTSICQDTWSTNLFRTISAIQPQEASGVGGVGTSGGVLTTDGRTAEEQGAYSRLGNLFGAKEVPQLRNDQLAVAHPIVIQDPATFGKCKCDHVLHSSILSAVVLVASSLEASRISALTSSCCDWLCFIWSHLSNFVSLSSSCFFFFVLFCLPFIVVSSSAIKRRRWHAVFFLNTGVVSAVNHDGSRSWKALTKSNWLTSKQQLKQLNQHSIIHTNNDNTILYTHTDRACLEAHAYLLFRFFFIILL